MAVEDSAAAAQLDNFELEGLNVDPAWNWIWVSWHRLNCDRSWKPGGMGPPIPLRISWDQVIKWCECFGYSMDEALFMDVCFGKMDSVYFDWYNTKVKAK